MEDRILCGLDEAGRGPLAGPVTAGAVILPKDFDISILNDSKKLSEKKRLAAYNLIKEKSLWGLAVVDHETIDRINILQASLLAMKQAFEMILLKYDSWLKENNYNYEDYPKEKVLCIADGIYTPDITSECICEPKADGKYPSVMAASIIAKVSRDLIMNDFDVEYPEYGYKKHKGYPTKAHREICKKIGPSPIQRMTFKY